MDPASLATAMIGAQMGQFQMAVAARMVRMSIDQDAAVAKLIEAGQQSLSQLANVGAGVGTQLDVTA